MKRYHNLPKLINISEYSQARYSLIKYFGVCNKIKSVYEFGSVTYPGISDLDIIVVSEEENEFICELVDTNNIPNNVIKLMDGGTLIVMGEKEFEKIKYWDDVNLTKIYGNNILIKNYVGLGKEYIHLCRLLDWIPERLVKIYSMLNSKPLNVKYSIGYLYSFSLSLKNAGYLFGEKNENYTNYHSKIHNLRNDWFKDINQSIKEMISCLKLSLTIGRKVINIIDKYIIEHGLVDNLNRNNNTYSFNFRNSMIYVLNEKYNIINDEEYIKINNNNIAEIILPISFYYFYAVYSMFGGIVGNTMKKFIIPIPTADIYKIYDSSLFEIQRNRMKICNDLASFLLRNKLKHGLFKYGWFYPP